MPIPQTPQFHVKRAAVALREANNSLAAIGSDPNDVRIKQQGPDLIAHLEDAVINMKAAVRKADPDAHIARTLAAESAVA